MLIVLKGVCDSFVKICQMPIPLGNGSSIAVGTFFVATLGIILAFKFIRGMFA